jgi:hypothetical protein
MDNVKSCVNIIVLGNGTEVLKIARFDNLETGYFFFQDIIQLYGL